MAVDERLAEMVAEGTIDVAFRVYSWAPACISLGRFQKAEDELDLGAVEREGIGLVRRATGGRAVWHHRELTYSLAARVDNPLVSGDVKGSFAKVAEPLLAALNSVGIHAEVTSGEPPSEGKRLPGNPCFSTAGAYEIAVGGRKLVGSAQVKSNGVMLQHGSILFHNDQHRLLDFVPPGPAKERSAQMAGVLRASVVSLAELGFSGPGVLLREALIQSFSQWVPGGLQRWSSKDLLGPELDAMLARKKALQ